MSGRRNKLLRRKFIQDNGRSPKGPQYNILGQVVEGDEWRAYKKIDNRKSIIQKYLEK